MLTVVTVPAKELKDCFSCLSLIAGRGSQLTPVSLSLKDNRLTFVCLQGCLFQGSISVASTEMAQTVFMYYDVTSIISNSGDVEITLSEFDVTIRGIDFNCSFPLGYSEVTEYDFSECKFTQITDNGYIDNLRTVLSMNLDKLYGKPVPFNIYGNIAVIKHACCYVQFRTPGLEFKAQVDPEHVKMITKFKPWEVSDTIPDTLVFKRKSMVLQLPCRSRIPENDFLSYLEGMKQCTLVTPTGLSEKLSLAARVSNRSKCSVVGTKSGLRITVSVENASSSVSAGDMNQEMTVNFTFPISTLLSFMKGIGAAPMEILTGGELICLRTKSLIILVRVEY